MKRAALLLILLLCAGNVLAQAQYKPTPENLKAREWFQDAKFGMFIHWGVYSVLGDGEWVMNNKRIPISEYEKLAPQFNPVEFNAAEWVALAKAAGMKYITITSKHHDGFAMFGTKQTDWNIVDRTPWKQDPMKMLADECRSSSSSTTRNSTGIIPITSHAAERAGLRGGRRAASGIATSTSWTRSCASCSRITERSAASGLTACGTGRRPTGGWQKHTA
jgi:hypothetical protein